MQNIVSFIYAAGANKNGWAPRLPRSRKAISLLELMIVIAMVTILTGVAVPSILRGRAQAQITVLCSEFRANYEAFAMYAQEKAQLPDSSAAFSAVPPGMRQYMPRKSTWELDGTDSSIASPQYRGRWFWMSGAAVPGMAGYNGFIHFYSPDMNEADAQKVDLQIDDGNTSTGALRFEGQTLTLGIQ